MIAMATLTEQKYISVGSTKDLQRLVKNPTAIPGIYPPKAAIKTVPLVSKYNGKFKTSTIIAPIKFIVSAATHKINAVRKFSSLGINLSPRLYQCAMKKLVPKSIRSCRLHRQFVFVHLSVRAFENFISIFIDARFKI